MAIISLISKSSLAAVISGRRFRYLSAYDREILERAKEPLEPMVHGAWSISNEIAEF